MKTHINVNIRNIINLILKTISYFILKNYYEKKLKKI